MSRVPDHFRVDQFLKDVEKHELTVIRDEGVHRHLRFKRPGSYSMFFDIVTWPGYLCYTGDMGTYVFQRLEDMLEFFRRSDEDRKYRIDFRYWAEKVQAQDKGDGITEFSVEAFKAEVKDYFDQDTDDADVWPAEAKAELWGAIQDDVLSAADQGEHYAWAALHNFTHPMPPGQRGACRDWQGREMFGFTDWEFDCRVYSYRFMWCCHALAWAIKVYDDSKAAQPAKEAA